MSEFQLLHEEYREPLTIVGKAAELASRLELWHSRKEKSGNWLDFILKEREKGLGSIEGGWDIAWGLVSKDDESLEEVQSYFAAEMVNKILSRKFKKGGSNHPDLDVTLVKDDDGQVVGVEKEFVIKTWPYVMRFLRPGSDGKPASFVDVVFEEEVFVGGELVNNPFDQINWSEMIDRGTTDLNDVEGVSIGDERFLSDWMREESSSDARGEFYRPDVVIGRNTSDFEVGEMSRDGRPLLIVGLGESTNGRAGSVKITMPTHVPIDGMEVALSAKETLNSLSQSRVKGLMDFVDDENRNDTLSKEDRELAATALEREKKARVLTLESWLARRLQLAGVDNDMTMTEKILEEEFFKHPEMLVFGKIFNVRRGLVASEMSPELTKLLLATKKEYQKNRLEKTGQESKVRVQFFTALAVVLMDGRYPGFMAVPDGEKADDQDGRLMVGALGLKMMRVIRKVKELVGSKEKETEDYLAQRLFLDELSESVEDTNNINEAIGVLEKKQKELKSSDNSEAIQLVDELLENLRADREISKEIIEGETKATRVDYFYDRNISINYKDEGGLLKVLGQIKKVFQSGMEVFSTKNQGVETTLVENMNNLFSFSSSEGFLLTRKMIEDAAAKERIKIVGDSFEFRFDRGEDWIKGQLKNLQRTIFEKVAEDYYKKGAKDLVNKLRSKYEQQDRANVQSWSADLAEEIEKAGRVLDKMIENPKGSASSVSSDIRFTETIAKEVKFILKGVRGIVAAMEVEESTSGLLIRDQLGVPVDFQSALAKNTKMDLATIDGSYSMKVSADNPRAMLEVVLPYLRSNDSFAKELFAFCIESDSFNKKDQEIMDEILYQDGYAGFMDRGNTKDNRVGGYREKRSDAVVDAYRRQELVDEASLFFRVFNTFIIEFQNKDIAVPEDVGDSVNRLVDGGFNRLWEAQLEYRAMSYPAELANLIYIFQMGLNVKGDYLEIRQERAKAQWAQEEAMSDMQILIGNDLREVE